MAMVCPQCANSYEQRLYCPRCDVRLNFQEGARSSSGISSSVGWQHTIWGRLLIGLILAQGIYHGVRSLFVAILVATTSVDQKELWASLEGFLLLQGLQLVSLFIGGLLAGAGQRQGLMCGVLLGIWNGILVVLIQPEMSERFNTVTLYGLPLLQGAVGGLSAWLGSLIWRPITPSTIASRQAMKKPVAEGEKWFIGPVYWTRVVIGTGVAVGGGLWAGLLLDKVIKLSSYNLSTQSALQAQVVTWEIVALAILAGGAIAGATTRNGLMQGLAVGVATALILVAIRMFSANPPSFLLLASALFGPVVLAVMGGGFGSRLLPPVSTHRRRALDTA